MIGHCLAKTIDDAIHFCLLLDLTLLAIGLWSLSKYDEDSAIAELRTREKVTAVGAAIGLVSVVLFKAPSQKFNAIAIILAAAAACVFAFTVYSEASYSSAVSKMAERGMVVLSNFFWPSEILQYVFILVMVLNHLLLAHHGRLELRARHVHKQLPRSDDPAEVL